MAVRNPWNSAYEGSPPWDIGRPQPEFARLAQAGKLMGRTLDVGCGTGAPACYLAANHGARVTGITNSRVGLDEARARAERVIEHCQRHLVR